MMERIREFYNRHILEKRKETFFWAFLAFGFTVVLSRLIVLDVERGKAVFGYLYIKGYHIHHFYYGILLLIFSNWLTLIRYKRLYRRIFRVVTSIMFGGGLGLVTDEFGLLLTMEFGIKGNYWAPQSYYAIGIVSVIFLLSLLLLRAD